MKRFFGVALAVLALTACSDDTGVGPGRQPGYLYFNVSEGQGWADGNKVSRSAVEAPMKMECSLNGEPIYLHTEVTPTMSPQLEASINNEDGNISGAETRGVRYTNDVFSLSSSSTKISSFGVYATRTSDRGVILSYAEITPDGTESSSPYAWNKKEQEIQGVWDSGTVDFYGYAPYFDNPSTDNGLSMTANSNGVPILTYTVPTDVTKQLDILTAKDTGVAKGEDVQLPFDHVMAAIKFNFKHGSTPDGTPADGGTPKDNFRWSDGLTTYDVKVTNIQITGVYKKGTWQVGDDPYDGARWTVDTSVGTGDFSYAPAKTLTGETSPVELNPDAGGNVFMMLPQQVPAGAKVLLTCELTPDGESTATKNMSLSVNLLETDGTTPKTWLPGYTYTYTMSLSDFVYVFDYNTATAKNYGTSGTAVAYAGTSEEDVFIRSYKMDSKGNKTNVEWWPEYEETEADAIGVGDGGADQTLWKKGNNGWIQVYDHSTGSYDTEVKTDHAGAHEGESDDIRLFKIAINTIMMPVKDLSMWSHDQTKRRRKRCTSNCYMVAGPGTYVIPLVYGNAITNGGVNTNAYAPGVSQNNAWPTFKNAFDLDIQSPYINEDLKYHGRQEAVGAALVWAEGNAAADQSAANIATLRASMGSDNNHPAGYIETDAERAERNDGTVIKVIPDIDTGVYDDDGYNTPSKYEGANYIKFEVKPDDFNYGNAVIGVRNAKPVGDNIVWSWHIWMVDPDWFIKDNTTLNLEGNEVTYANTNIGWVPGGVDVPEQTRTGHARLKQKESGNIITIDAEQLKRRAFTTYFTNVLYQWGRKDPVRGNVDPADMQTNQGAPRGPKGYRDFRNNMEGGARASLFVLGQTTTVGNMIRTPNTIYGQSDGDLYNYGAQTPSNLWAARLQKYYITNGGTWLFQGKTIYDPSPVGYCVPPSKYLTHLRRAGFGEISASTQTDAQILQRGIICTYTANTDEGSGKTLQFHASGIRTTSSGYDLHSRGLHQPWTSNAANGFYHTATPFTDDENWQLHLYFYPLIDTHNFIRGDMCECLSVKPVLWDGEIDSASEEEDPAEQYLTLEAGGLYWADAQAIQTSRTIQWTKTPADESSWQSVTSSYDGAGESLTNLNEGTKIAAVSKGDKIYVRGTNATYCIKSGLTYYYNYFRTTGSYELSGNIMSLTWGTDFKGKTAFQDGSTFTFCSLFYNPQFGTDANRTLESIDGLVMPATTLVTSCYESMFQGCQNLVSAPLLPATAGATDCYKNMYRSCSALTTVKSMLHNPSSSYTDEWLNGVASNGSFFYSKGVTTWPTGTDGIPSG